MILHLLLLGLFVTSKINYNKHDTRGSCVSSSSVLFEQKTLEVCLSPGCAADGAVATLHKLQALAPATVTVKPGVCCSLCGNGPVVLDIESNKKFKRVVGTKLLDLLFNEQDLTPQQDAILKGYNLIMEADEAMSRSDYGKAAQLYEEGLALGLQPALDMQQERDKIAAEDEDSLAVPPALRWLIKARQAEASAKLKKGDADGAVRAVKSACELARNSSSEAFELLQEVYQTIGDRAGELGALQSLFNLPQPETPTVQMQNKRRTLGFRLTKLQKELKA